MKKAEIAADRARKEWAKLTARAREASKQRDEEVIVKQEEESVDNVEHEIVVERDEGENNEFVEKGEKEEVEGIEEARGEVEERFYSQLELSDMEGSKRGLLNWVMQMEYAGKTFFDGYVFSPSSRLLYRSRRRPIINVGVVVIVVVVLVEEIGWILFENEN